MFSESQLCNIEDKVYFEAICLLETNAIPPTTPKDRFQLLAFGKISRFCRESGLHAYIVKFMVHPSAFLASVSASLKHCESDDQFSSEHYKPEKTSSKNNRYQHMIFLTKQKLIPSTGYYCKISNLSARLFGNAQVLLGNSVKRILAKSDSKFVEKFALLLEIGVVYVCKRRYQDIPQPADDFKKVQRMNESDIYYKFTSPAAGKLSLSIYSQSTLPQSLNFMLSLPNQQIPSFKCNPTSAFKLAETALSLPNLLICLPTDPPTVQAYVLAKITEGNQEEGVCTLGTIAPQREAISNSISVDVSGLGAVYYRPWVSEEIQNEAEVTSKQENLPQPREAQPRNTEDLTLKEKTLSTSNHSTKAFSSKLALSAVENKENLTPNLNRAAVTTTDPEFPPLQIVQPTTRRYSENDKAELLPPKNPLVLGSKAFDISRALQIDEISGDEMPLPKPMSRSKEAADRKLPSLSVDKLKEDPDNAGVVSDSVLQTVGLLYSQEKNSQTKSKVKQRRQRVETLMEQWRLGAFRNRRYTLF